MERAFTKYIEESNKIHDGPPARYRLNPVIVNLDGESDREYKLTRFTLGKRNTQIVNRTVLLVGATGTGKSTLVNVLVNFVMGVKYEDKVWFEIVTDEKDRPQTETQTTDVCVYEVFGFEGITVPYSLTIIDTPGYGDTRGIEYDQIITKKLEDLFCAPDGVDTVDAVGLVLKASENRLDDKMAYIFNSVTSLFGKDMEKNIVVMMTHSDGRKPKNALQALENAQIKWAKDKNNEPVYFLFNNCQKDVIEEDDDEHDKDNNSDNKDKAQDAFKMSEKNISKFTIFLKESQPQSLKTTVAVIKERIRLEACVQNLKDRVKDIEEKQAAITKNKEKLSKYEQKIKEKKDFIIQVEETYKERVKIDAWWDYKAVSCLKCEETCHYPGCTWAWSPSQCEVMKSKCTSCSGKCPVNDHVKEKRCTSCTGKCPVDDHVKERWRYETKTRTVTKTIEEFKAIHEKSKFRSEEKTTLLETMEKELSDLQQSKEQCLNEAFNIIQQLEKIALSVDSVYTYIHLDYLMEKMNELGDTEKVQKLKRMTTQNNEHVKSAAKYFKRLMC